MPVYTNSHPPNMRNDKTASHRPSDVGVGSRLIHYIASAGNLLSRVWDMSAEKARERDVYRYYQSWIESCAHQKNFRSPPSTASSTLDGPALNTPKDKALIAFAQLGCLRLNAKRGIVTLISSQREHVIAEATKTMSLVTGAGSTDEDQPWFGHASLPRSQGISQDVLDPHNSYTATASDGSNYTAPALVINDITKHKEYNTKGFAGKGVTFYSGVPLVSSSGYTIGVYTVTDDKPRDGLHLDELKFMQDMASVVMTHLEAAKNNSARFRGEKMVMGLGSFLKGQQSIHDASDNKIQANRNVPSQEVVVRLFNGMDITDVEMDIGIQQGLRRPAAEGSTQSNELHSSVSDNLNQTEMRDFGDKTSSELRSNHPDQPSPSRPQSSSKAGATDKEQFSNKISNVFTRAASILRDCTEADGVMFFDVTSVDPPQQLPRSDTIPLSRYSGADPIGMSGARASSPPDGYDYITGFSTDSEQEFDARRGHRNKRKDCRVMGYSLDASDTPSANANSLGTRKITKRIIKHLIRRYPQGKVFYFTDKGDISSSDVETSASSIDSSSAVEISDDIVSPGSYNNKQYKSTSRIIAEELFRALPEARNVIWLPLWDFTKQRWCSGTFIWSRRPESLLAAQDDLMYIKAFGNSIMTEVSRLDAITADAAKSTFIANVSHELRSPLHGILGSTEFLQETPLDAFQSSMTAAIDTCGRTLLDTLEHILDYAKINRVSRNSSNNAPGLHRSQHHGSQSIMEATFGMSDDVDLANLFEEAVEAVCTGETFQNASKVRRPALSMFHGSIIEDDSKEETRQKIEAASSETAASVKMILDIQQQNSWWFHTQPGAIRRMVMNIVGNALKFTENGTIRVSLSCIESAHESAPRTISMAVEDTGKSMSTEFLQNHAFTPFYQESQFSPGTGLGLSIVQQIANSMGGKVELQSEQGVGTKIEIRLTVPPRLHPSASSGHNLLESVRRKTTGMSMCLLRPPVMADIQSSYPGNDENKPSTVESSLRNLALTWFGIQTMESSSMTGISPNFFVYAEPPPIDYLLRHHGSSSGTTEVPFIIITTNAFESSALAANGINRLVDLGRIIEVISQPCGPQKLARAFHRCLSRLELTKNSPDTQNSNNASIVQVRDRVVENIIDNTTDLNPTRQIDGNRSLDRNEMKTLDRDEQISRPAQGTSNSRTDNTGADPSSISTPTTSSDVKASLPQPTLQAPTSRGRTHSGHSEAEKSHSILLVDDNDINLKLLIAFAKKAKYSYQAAINGLEALQAYEKASGNPETAFRFILMDISMPVMDGFAATRAIREHERKTGIEPPAVIIALSGLASTAAQGEMFEAGADFYLAKPVKFRNLMDIFQRWPLSDKSHDV